MKSKIPALLTALILLIGVSFFLKKTTPPPAPQEAAKKILYQCPMHPQIIRSSPGQCPLCGMDLRPMEQLKETGPVVPNRAPIAVSARKKQLIGVTYGEVKIRPLAEKIDAPGRIAYDPKLYQAVEEYRQAFEALKSVKYATSEAAWARSMEKAAALKLKLLGLSPAQVSQWLKNPESAQSLLLGKRGEAVWVYADVYEYNLPLIHPGLPLEIRSQTLPGKTWSAKIISIDPVINPETRTARVRARLDDVLGLLKPGTYVDVTIQSPLGNLLSVPDGAVLDTGENQYVFVAGKDGTLTPTPVTLGKRAQGYMEVLSGLKAGQTVVTSANFLIDAESQFQSAIKSFAKPASDSSKDSSSGAMGSMPGMKM